ncbi:hypothetical protein EZI54_07495, partial [Marinobacter halodurans]
MSQRLPAFFPLIRNPDIRIAPISSGASWFAAIYWRNDAVSESQYQKLISNGFVPGKQGRLFYPRPMEPQMMESVCRLLGGAMEVLRPEHTVVLESGAPFESPLPDEIRQGIAWWWRHNRQALAQEVRMSLEGSSDEGVRAIATQYSEGQWRNPDRLKQWVSQALDGELEPVTEPIVGLGLSWAIDRVGQGDEISPELADWRATLAKYRGEVVNEVPARPANLATQLAASSLPKIGQRVRWRDDGSNTIKKGVVKRHSGETEDAIWVLPDRPHYVSGLTMPQVIRVFPSQLLDHVGPEPVKPSEAASEGGEATKVEGRSDILPTDIPCAALQHMESDEYPPSKIRNYLRVGLASQHIRGIHPLSPFVSKMEDEGELVLSFKASSSGIS